MNQNYVNNTSSYLANQASTTVAEDFASETQQNLLESSMKDLLEKILTYLEKFIQTKEDLAEIETKLNDYDNLQSLLDIIKTIFSHLTTKVDESLAKKAAPAPTTSSKQLPTNNSPAINPPNNEDYDQLEKILQKHEAEIRVHIRQNQTMKLYSENLQQKLEESEASRTGLLESTKAMMHDIKRQNNSLSEKISSIENENRELKEKIKDFQEKALQVPFLQERISQLERLAKGSDMIEKNEKLLAASMNNLQKESNLKKDLDNLMIRKQIKNEPLANTMTTAMLMAAALPSSHHHNTSPMKVERRSTPTPNQQQSAHVHTSSGKGTIPTVTTSSLKQSYQRFYNNIKFVKEENREVRNPSASTYTNNQPVQKSTTVIQQSAVRERDNSKNMNPHNSGGNSLSNSHNNSFAINGGSSVNYTNSIHNSSSKATIQNTKPSPSATPQTSVPVAGSASSHKRSKSHQINNIRGVIPTNSNIQQQYAHNMNNVMTDHSRLSSHHDFSETHNSIFK